MNFSFGQLFIIFIFILLFFGDLPKIIKTIKKNLKSFLKK